MRKTDETREEQQRRVRTITVNAAVQEIINNGGVLMALRGGSPGSYGDAGLGGHYNADGTFESWFSCGDIPGGGKVVRPATRP